MIKFDLSNRVAVITGGAQGFGFAIAERFIQSGAKVVIWDIDEQEAKKAVEKINSENISYKIVNVCNFEEISKSLKDIETEHNKIDIFVNNAGITGMNKTVAEYPIEEWEKIIQLNERKKKVFCLIAGSQGSGKTTLSQNLKKKLQSKKFRVLVLSIDNFYSSKKIRNKLSKKISKLFITRGVPGTHNFIANDIIVHNSHAAAYSVLAF